MFDALIIGGGITGLSAGSYMAARGIRFQLLESATRTGGVMMTTSRDGFILESGPNVLVEKPALKELLENAGLSSSVVRPNPERFRQLVFHAGRTWDVPRGIAALARTQLIPRTEKLRLVSRFFTGVPTLSGPD